MQCSINLRTINPVQVARPVVEKTDNGFSQWAKVLSYARQSIRADFKHQPFDVFLQTPSLLKEEKEDYSNSTGTPLTTGVTSVSRSSSAAAVTTDVSKTTSGSKQPGTVLPQSAFLCVKPHARLTRTARALLSHAHANASWL